MINAGIYIKIWECDGMTIKVVDSSQHSLDAAVSHYLDTGRDTLIQLADIDGAIYVTRASRVVSWITSTPEIRRCESEHAAAYKEEQNSYKAEFGWVDD